MYNLLKLTQQKCRYNIHLFFNFILPSLIFTIIFCPELKAQGNLLISPHRVIFEGQKKLMGVTLANTGQDSAKYSISFVHYRMTDDGSYEEITDPDPGQNFADDNIRFFPRTVMLGPNESQTIRLQLIKLDQMKPGEYRSHLYFRSIPNQSALGEENKIKDTTSINIKIVPIFGISIPIIVKVGESTTTLNITDPKIDTTSKEGTKLLFTIHRTGNMSSYGDILITHISPNGKETKIGSSVGVAIYTPTILQNFKVNLAFTTPLDLKKGKIHILYSTHSESRPEKLAESILEL